MLLALLVCLTSIVQAQWTPPPPPVFNGTKVCIKGVYLEANNGKKTYSNFYKDGASRPDDSLAYGYACEKFDALHWNDSIRTDMLRRNTADYVEVVFRNSAFTWKYAYPAVLKLNGDIVNFRGEDTLNVPLYPDVYWIEIVHRNSIPVVSHQPYRSDAPINLRFDDPNFVYGINPLKPINGRYFIFAGDCSRDRYVETLDQIQAYNDRDSNGYRFTDMDMSGKTTWEDIYVVMNNFWVAEQAPWLKKTTTTLNRPVPVTLPADMPTYKLTAEVENPTFHNSNMYINVYELWTNPNSVKEFRIFSNQLIINFNTDYLNGNTPVIAVENPYGDISTSNIINDKIRVYMQSSNPRYISEKGKGTLIARIRISVPNNFAKVNPDFKWFNTGGISTKVGAIVRDTAYNITDTTQHFMGDILTGINNENTIVTNYKLEQNYPNPFNPTTSISYSIKEKGMVKLEVYNIIGKEVAVLVNEELNSGNYEVDFNGSNLSSGVYFYKLQAGGYSSVKRMLLIK